MLILPFCLCKLCHVCILWICKKFDVADLIFRFSVKKGRERGWWCDEAQGKLFGCETCG